MKRFDTGRFGVEYSESEVFSPVLWESHCHTEFEMIAVLEGDVTVMLEGKSHRLQKNRIAIIPPLSYHAITANEKGLYRRITALFNEDAIPEVLHSAFKRRGREATIFSSRCAERIRELFQKEEQAFYVPLLHSLMVEIFYEALQTRQADEKNDSADFLQRTLQYVDAHLHEKISLDELAQYAAMSKSSFCHSFETRMNISPKQYILQKKISVAKKLIDDGMPRTVAAMQVGYENYSNFYRLYLKHFGGAATKREAPQD